MWPELVSGSQANRMASLFSRGAGLQLMPAFCEVAIRTSTRQLAGAHCCDPFRLGERHAAVVRPGGKEAVRPVEVDEHELAVGPDYRLNAGNADGDADEGRRRPRHAAVARRLDSDRCDSGLRKVRVGDVTTTLEGARRAVVARDPALVEVRVLLSALWTR